MDGVDDQSNGIIDKEADLPLILLVGSVGDSCRSVLNDFQGEYCIVEAANAAEAYDEVIKVVPDLVVTDLMMPDMDGVELCRRLRNEVSIAHVPVLICSNEVSVEIQVACLEAGADDYIAKPFNRQVLCARIHNLLQLRRLLSRHYSQQTIPNRDELTSRMPQDIGGGSRVDRDFGERLSQILREHHTDPDFNIDLLAAKLNMSQRTVQRKIKALVNLTPVQLIAEYRLNEVEALLRKTRVNVTEIAYQLGFGDLSHFYRIFKRKYGMSPSQYREVKT